MQTSAYNRKRVWDCPSCLSLFWALAQSYATQTDVAKATQPILQAYFTSSTFNFVIADSGMQESHHSILRDIQPQSCKLGTDMLGTSA